MFFRKVSSAVWVELFCITYFAAFVRHFFYWKFFDIVVALATLAQLVERRIRNAQASGSIPEGGSLFMNTFKRLIVKLAYPLIRLYWRIIKPKTCGARALVIHDSKILLVKNMSSNHWSFPGGKVEKGETPEMCVLRELHEELSLNLMKIDDKLGEYIHVKEGKRDTVHIFIINITAPDFVRRWELDDACWFSLNDLPQTISPATSRRINEFRLGIRQIVASW